MGRTSDRPSRRRFGGPTPESHVLGESLERLLAIQRLGTTSELVELISKWRELVGERMAAHATPRKIEDGELVVAVDHSAWATELRVGEAQLISRLKIQMPDATINRLKVHVRTVSDVE
jgi:predicted nucleic acid-binding Zn ribbon protein